MKWPLARLSFCPCGFPVLDESITLGTEYDLLPNSVRGGFFYRCGGCGREYKDVHVVTASQILHPERPPAPLPWSLFITRTE